MSGESLLPPQNSSPATTPTSQTDSARTAMPMPEMRTPQNQGYLISAYLVAAVIYGGYLTILLRRRSALRVRQQRVASIVERQPRKI